MTITFIACLDLYAPAVLQIECAAYYRRTADKCIAIRGGYRPFDLHCGGVEVHEVAVADRYYIRSARNNSWAQAGGDRNATGDGLTGICEQQATVSREISGLVGIHGNSACDDR